MNRKEEMELADMIEDQTSPIMYDILLSKPEREAICTALRASAAPEEGRQIWLLAGRLAGAELNYRNAYEQLGGSHMETGRAWDKLRQAGNAIREISDSVWDAALAPATEGGTVTHPSARREDAAE